MEIFEKLKQGEYENLILCHDRDSGLKAVIAIHDTSLGPALGGCRMWNYSTEEDAIIDVMRLAKAMTYKSAMAEIKHGGGKAVIIGDPYKDKNASLLKAFGKFVNRLNGLYITAEDVGIRPEDIEQISQTTSFTVGKPVSKGGSGSPSWATAFGVFNGIKACLKFVYGSENLTGIPIVIQGVGSVGYDLARYLAENRADLYISDIDKEKAKKIAHLLKTKVCDPDEIFDIDCTVFSPCALGGIINDETIPRLKCKIIAGAANNQLLEERHGEVLHKKGVLYAPDYVINAGGLINVSEKLVGYSRDRVTGKVKRISDRLSHLFKVSKAGGISTLSAANRIAEQRIEEARLRKN